jgi:hypothetical protein
VLAEQVHDAPPTVSLLNVSERERSHLRTSQSAAEQHGQNATVAEALLGRSIRCVEQRLGLLDREPIAESDTFGRHAFHARDAVCQFGR